MKFQGVEIIISQCVQWSFLDLGQTYLEEQLTIITERTFASPSRKGDEKQMEKEKQEAGVDLSVCVLSLLP